MKRLWMSLIHSLNGLQACLRAEASFRQELVLAVIPATIAVFIPLSLMETLLLIVTYVNILIAELFNSAIERTVDYISPEKHPLAKTIKDIASAAVFLAILVFLTVCLALIIKKLQ